jgi:hypothetical protein
MIVNGKQIPRESLTIEPNHKKSTVMAYNTLFTGTGIHHSNSGLQITNDIYFNGYFILLHDLTPDLATAEGHTSPVEAGTIRIELAFKEALQEAITCLLYLEYDNSVRIYSLRSHHRPLNMHTVQISCTLNNVKSFLGAFPSHMIPHSITQPNTIIVNTDAHTSRERTG